MSLTSLIDAHLDQISACAQTIHELNFPAPKIFTNALLRPHDITTLIRDTETHERALFSVPKEENRRKSIFPPTDSIHGQNTVRGPRRNTAVAAVLGGDLVERIRKGGGGGAGSGLGYREGGGKGEVVDVDVLLEGAERLVGVYPIAGALERIAKLRERHVRLRSSINYYEELSAQQAEQLGLLNKPRDFGQAEVDADDEEEEEEQDFYTQEDYRQEEQTVRDLERKKKTLETRVAEMDKDLDF